MIPNNKHIRFLKTLCHQLSPVVRIGQKGVTESVQSELEIALAHHELIKIKVGMADRDERRSTIAALAEKSESYVIQQVGQVAVLFRRNHEKPVIEFPSSIKAGAKIPSNSKVTDKKPDSKKTGAKNTKRKRPATKKR